uniref:Uncharacterized protein n=1 Tax=virus sp. ct3kA5 TaxID=2826790 RepID=A0A8S5R7P7_9VIRU|nr:MAG TPA: hypothetical protein [virus sp. ct3kA5]
MFLIAIIKCSKDLNLNVNTYHLATWGKYKSI